VKNSDRKYLFRVAAMLDSAKRIEINDEAVPELKKFIQISDFLATRIAINLKTIARR